jgi:Xaa-Pro aminopeptidase
MGSDNESGVRLMHLQQMLALEGIDVVAIAPTPNMRYLIGFAPKYDERFCALLVTPTDAQLIVPQVNADQVDRHTGLISARWADETGPLAALEQALDHLNVRRNATLAADGLMQARHLLLLHELASQVRLASAEPIMESLRMVKSADELARLAGAAAQADRAMQAGVEHCRPGMSELSIADAIASSFRVNGAEQVDFTIVASGPNSAFPHHHSGTRRLQSGDTIILDIGATFDGYKSDITRVVQLGESSAAVDEIYAAVLAGNRAGRAAVRPGISAREVDQATREPIDRAGYGDLFFHRTGHGLGIEEHEPPWISATSDTILQPGMVFSIEPGCYLPGRFGVRIEDIVVVTEDGCHCLTGFDHDLIVH